MSQQGDSSDEFELLSKDQLTEEVDDVNDQQSACGPSLQYSVLSIRAYSPDLFTANEDDDQNIAQSIRSDDAVALMEQSMREGENDPVLVKPCDCERAVQEFRLKIEELQCENDSLRSENEQHRTGLTSCFEEMVCLQKQVDMLLKENRQLKANRVDEEQAEWQRQMETREMQREINTLRSLNLAFQMQVDADVDHVTALKDRHSIELEMLRHGSGAILSSMCNEANLTLPNSNWYSCVGCSEKFCTQERLIVHLHRCDEFQKLD